MKIILENLGKKFGKHWIFKNINHTINPGDQLSLTGHNGSGKSTLLQITGSYISPTRGKIHYEADPVLENPQLQFSLAAPYLNLIEEFTLSEQLNFHARFKKPLLTPEEMIAHCGLRTAKDKLLAEFSSGMKQRVRLALVFFYDCQLILLDEPCSNLDLQGTEWYHQLIEEFLRKRTLIVASNQIEEYKMCKKNINIEDFR